MASGKWPVANGDPHVSVVSHVLRLATQTAATYDLLGRDPAAEHSPLTTSDRYYYHVLLVLAMVSRLPAAVWAYTLNRYSSLLIMIVIRKAIQQC